MTKINQIEWKPSGDLKLNFKLHINEAEAKSLCFYVEDNEGRKHKYTWESSLKITKK